MSVDQELLFDRMISKAEALLNHSAGSMDQIEAHELKSLLYAAIERVGFAVERARTVQRLIRELFSIINLHSDLQSYEKDAGRQILRDLTERYAFEFIVMSINHSRSGENQPPGGRA